MAPEMFVTASRCGGDLAGVFEYTEGAGYFYLYRPAGKDRERILGAIHVCSGAPDFAEPDLLALPPGSAQPPHPRLRGRAADGVPARDSPPRREKASRTKGGSSDQANTSVRRSLAP